MSKKVIKQKLNIQVSNFKFLEDEFGDMILEKYDYDQTEQKSQPGIIRKKYVFKDGSFLSITEHYRNDGYISYYNYDWYTKEEKIIKFYHSEPHWQKKHQTKTEPFHTHRVDFSKMEIREHNYGPRDLYGILEEIEEEFE